MGPCYREIYLGFKNVVDGILDGTSFIPVIFPSAQGKGQEQRKPFV